jgi:uncharacterized membrane protein YphA (DoxX/SURF4 family)
MTLLRSTAIEPVPSRIAVFTTWLLRVAIALAFLSFGSQKFASTGMWVSIFAQIGFGQWFRYATGAIQIAGAVLVLIPATTVVGDGLLACTMLGATLAWMTVLHAPGNAVIPGALFLVLLGVAVAERSRQIL